MIVNDVINEIKNRSDYVANSLIIKRWDREGIVLKFLVVSNGIANRKEVFIAINYDENITTLEQQEVICYYYVEPAL